MRPEHGPLVCHPGRAQEMNERSTSGRAGHTLPPHRPGDGPPDYPSDHALRSSSSMRAAAVSPRQLTPGCGPDREHRGDQVSRLHVLSRLTGPQIFQRVRRARSSSPCRGVARLIVLLSAVATLYSRLLEEFLDSWISPGRAHESRAERRVRRSRQSLVGEVAVVHEGPRLKHAPGPRR